MLDEYDRSTTPVKMMSVKVQLQELRKGLQFVLNMEKTGPVDWETTYHVVFSPVVKSKIDDMANVVGLRVSWVDLDGNCEDDVRAYCLGCRKLLLEVEAMLEVAEQVWPGPDSHFKEEHESREL